MANVVSGVERSLSRPNPYAYSRANHFLSAIGRYSNKEQQIPSDVMDKVRTSLEKAGINPADANPRTIRNILKQEKLSLYYDIVPSISQKLGSPVQIADLSTKIRLVQNKAEAISLSEDYPFDCCSICLDDIDIKSYQQLSCKHIFHRDCIGEWTKKEKTCPICRAKIMIEKILDKQFDQWIILYEGKPLKKLLLEFFQLFNERFTVYNDSLPSEKRLNFMNYNVCTDKICTILIEDSNLCAENKNELKKLQKLLPQTASIERWLVQEKLWHKVYNLFL